MSKPGYPYPGLSVSRVREILRELVRVDVHHFWPDSLSLVEANRIDLDEVGPKQLTDLYLLALADKVGGRLVSFDRTIPWQALMGCKGDSLEILTGEKAR